MAQIYKISWIYRIFDPTFENIGKVHGLRKKI